MSTITTNSQSLFDVLRPLLPMNLDASYQVNVDDGKIEIQVLKDSDATATPPSETFEERRHRILKKLHSRTVRGVGLSEWALSREAIYSEDHE
jgi:hypothetical protein